ncbi:MULTISPECIES: AAA family ATPase [unclassified Rathayibacter]|uniref:AAA family ATPase n=1 Tax=unclassified Rathayibacter TaxID=2609250 RepID=UPI0006FE6905|nr:MULTISPECIES: AAA family ATPase [unclassified Rathayibacter]KQQ03459.1 AAA family ATPase [Rathayibacter sp. Leaf294]KQS11915.1 AAA family ATPase [Rathayibacter sp. Leaf185]
MNLDDLGERVCIIGPSNSGKSTLAVAIGRARGIPIVHLDQYWHLPGTHWVERGADEFALLHAAAVAGDRWVIEGNYSRWLPERLDRATGLIALESTTTATVFRYLRRTWSRQERIGGLEGTRDRVSLAMLRFLLGPSRRSRDRYRRLHDEATVPSVLLSDRAALDDFTRRNGLR